MGKWVDGWVVCNVRSCWKRGDIVKEVGGQGGGGVYTLLFLYRTWQSIPPNMLTCSFIDR